jgi:hypothetical protein
MIFTFYDASGQISGFMGEDPRFEVVRHINFPGCDYVEGHYDHQVYWINPNTKQPTLRVPLPYVLSPERLLSGYPPGTQLSYEGETYTLEDSTSELEFDVPGTYRVELTHPSPQYLPTLVTVNVP